ncbi:MAG: hypothetical protein IPM43_10165 [Actinomycetota bacterium]|nr:MAG: hypothetical protein IPM43_10165 [Actinomycetota bacterium]
MKLRLAAKTGLRAGAVAAVLVGAACSGDDGGKAAPTTASSIAPPETTDAPATDAPATDSPATDAPTTDAPTTQPESSSGPQQHEVATVTATFVDESRPTPRSGDVAALPQRTLETLLFYPATDTGEPDTEGGPYPLVLFAHGLGATTDFYADILEGWAAAGYVVAAPAFPLSNANSPAGPDAADVANQPGDLSFLADQLTDASSGALPDVLAGMIDADRIGVGGHSNGGITTLGLVANSCCRDDRIDAAVVLAGTPVAFAGGSYDFADAPPMLLVHGTRDVQISWIEAVNVATSAEAPRGLLSLEGEDHGSWIRAGDPPFPSVVEATVAFFDAFLRGDGTAIERLMDAGEPGLTTLHFVTDEDDELVIPTTVPPVLDRQASVTPATDLVDGQVVTVSWSGFTPGQVVNVVQCSNGATGGNDLCELTTGKILHPDPTGEGSLQLEIIVGPVGSGRCGVGEPQCVIVVNDASLQAPEATIRIPITFAG